MTTEIIENALSSLANSMRIHGEACLNYSNLVGIDKEEAINNLERAFESSLESFHTLYDVSKQIVNYFDYPDSTLIIALRNALHHKNHPLFVSFLPKIWLREDPIKFYGAAFLLARHSNIDGNPSMLHHYVKLEDIYSRLDPNKESAYLDKSLNKEKLSIRFKNIENGLSLNSIWDEARSERYPDKQVYIDIMPIFISALCRTFTQLRSAKINFIGYDADTYKKIFTSELKIDLNSIDFKMLRINDIQLALGPRLTINQAAIQYQNSDSYEQPEF